eukprot:s3235_g3.t1
MTSFSATQSTTNSMDSKPDATWRDAQIRLRLDTARVLRKAVQQQFQARPKAALKDWTGTGVRQRLQKKVTETETLLRQLHGRIEGTRELEEYLSERPRLELLLNTLQVAVLAAGVGTSFHAAVLGFTEATDTFSSLQLLQWHFFLPKQFLECAFERLLPPALPSLMHPLRCPEWYHHVVSLTWIVLGAVLALLELVGTFLILDEEWQRFLLGGTWPAMRVAGLLVAGAVASGMLISGFLTEKVPDFLDVHISLPKNLRSCSLQMVDAPVLVPVHAGANLSGIQLSIRLAYFTSLLLSLIVAAFLGGQLLTLMGRIWRGTPGAEYDAHGSYMSISPIEHLCLHLLCAGIVVFFVVTKRISIQNGICWEAYVMWVFVVLTCSILQALYFTVSLPTEAHVPNFGMPIVEGVLPVLGEPLDTFKDWIFIGTALCAKSTLGYVFVSLGALILLMSNLHLRKNHHAELARSLLLVRSACQPRRDESFLVKQTSPAKLAIALTEDLPQALLQSTFVQVYGGSPTQYAFIGISLVKICVCVSLRAVVLQREDRHGEAWEASSEFYRLKIKILGSFLGERHPWVLSAQRELACTLIQRGLYEQALELSNAVLTTQGQVYRDQKLQHEDFLDTLETVAWSLTHLGRAGEASQKFSDLLDARRDVLGPWHPNTFEARWGLARALDAAGRSEEAEELERETLTDSRRHLGPRHEHTLRAQRNYGAILRRVGRLQESEVQLREVLEVAREVSGRKHHFTQTIQYNLALTLKAWGRRGEALRELQELLQIRQEVLGPQHPKTLNILKLEREMREEIEVSGL